MAGRPDHPGGVSTLPWPTLLVTRPEPQGQAWVERLRAHGAAAEALPLIATAPPEDVGAVHRLWAQLPQTRAVMFVSPAAVHHLFDARPPDAVWPPGTLAAAPGPGTAAVLEAVGAAAGLTASQIVRPPDDADQYDSEHLWPMLAPLDWQGTRVLIASGGVGEQARGRAWLTQRWQAAGAQVEVVVCYQRGPSIWTEAQQSLVRGALAHPAQHLWLFSASEAVQHLVAHHLPALGMPASPDGWPIRALCTHPRVAEAAQAAGMTVCGVTSPDLEMILAQVRQLATKGPAVGAMPPPTVDTMPPS
jgi:uroporphyrinogen-III synthase